jgi:hypothetical protein
VNRIAIALLRAIAANTGGSHDVAAVETLDTLVTANVTAPFEWPGLYPSLVAARLFAANGRADRALTAVRRQSYYFPETTYLAASRALEAQLAAQVGDTDIAAAPRRELRKFQGPMRESDGSVIVTRPSAPASPNRPHGDAGSARTAGTTIER